MRYSKHGTLMAMAGTLALLVACGESPTAPAPGVTRFSGQDASVVPATLVSVTPLAASIAAGATQQYTATNSNGVVMVAPLVTWSVSGGGSINANGLFTAGAVAGTFSVTATDATNTAITVSVPVIVTAPVGTGTGGGTCKEDDDKKKCDTNGKDGKDNKDGKDGKGKGDEHGKNGNGKSG